MKNEEQCKFIEQAIHNHDIDAIINCARNEVELYPVIIPSYKNRYHYMYDYFEQNKIKFYVFVYEDDFTASGYDKYQFKYGEIVRITPEDFAQYGMKGKLLGKKRYYIQQYTKIHGIDKYFMIDDDYKPVTCACYPVLENGLTKNRHVDYIDALRTIQFIFDAYDLGICSATDGGRIRKYKFDVPYKQDNINGTFLVNNQKMIDYDIYWSKIPMFEDDDICVKSRLKQFPYGRIACIGVDNNCSRTKSVIPERDELAVNLFKEYPWCIDIQLKYNTELKRYNIIKVFHSSQIENRERNYNKEKYHAAKTMTVQELKQWLADKNNIDLSKTPEENKLALMDTFF